MSDFKKAFAFLADFMDFVSAGLAEPIDQAQLNQAAHKCLMSMLEATALLLSSTPLLPHSWSVRQLLIQVLKLIPVQIILEEPKADFVHWLRSCDKLSIPGLNLNEACSQMADIVRQAHYVLSGEADAMLEEMYAAYVEETTETPPDSDGPKELGCFQWNGKSYPFSPQQWRLLNALWGEKEVHVEMVREELGIEESTSGALRKLISDTRKSIEKWRLPFEILRPKKSTLQLKQKSVTAR